jgi:hypothetical protein
MRAVNFAGYGKAMTVNRRAAEIRIQAGLLDASHVGARFAYDDAASGRHLYGVIEGIEVGAAGIWLYARGRLRGAGDNYGAPIHLGDDSTIYLLIDDLED